MDIHPNIEKVTVTHTCNDSLYSETQHHHRLQPTTSPERGDKKNDDINFWGAINLVSPFYACLHGKLADLMPSHGEFSLSHNEVFILSLKRSIYVIIQ